MATWKLEAFDIETCSRPYNELQFQVPEFSPPKGWKDEEKIRENIEQQRANWFDQAALSPMTGQILAVVWSRMDGTWEIYDADKIGEAGVIQEIFRLMRGAGMGSNFKVTGFGIRSFDIPFLVRRAWVHRIETPTGLIQLGGKWANMGHWLIDMRDVWTLGDPRGEGKLGEVAELLGVGSKSLTGDQFARMWRDPVMHADALEYLVNDGRLPLRIAEVVLSTARDGYGLNIRQET